MDKTRFVTGFLSTQQPDRLVYLVTRDSNFAAFISQQITHFGYLVQHVRDVNSLSNTIADHHAVAILVDLDPAGAATDAVFAQISALSSSSLSIMFIAERDDQTVRMKSIQAGGVAFFTKPPNIVSLIDRLDRLNRSIPATQMSRVLIVEEQYTVASYFQMVIKMAGMDAQIAAQPDRVLEQVREYRPDLILMDTFMAEINTADLARVIRQMEDFVSIPIIFLSNDDNFEKRIEALDLGGDDYLVKPVKAAHLKAVVRSRIERSKILRSYMIRDGLTNLLNHTTFRSVLAQEVNRGRRQNTTLSLAMLDIDHFKMVNDSYGHAAGDSVLKGLSRLLQQRLRGYDIIGRYGGDEIVALMVDCGPDRSARIMNDIRQHFTEIDFYPEDAKPLHLTFSCGISTFPKFETAEMLNDMADQAMYCAKAAGRNQVIVA